MIEKNFHHEDSQYFNYNVDELLHLIAEGDENGCVPEFVLFSYPPLIPLGFAFEYMDTGNSKHNPQKAKAYLKKTKQTLNHMHPKNSARAYLEPIIDKLLQGEKSDFPLILHGYFRGVK